MNNTPESSPEHKERPEHNIAILEITPALNQKILESVQDSSPDALILITHASGAIPAWIAEPVKKLVENGIPTFIVSNNPADSHGILKEDLYATSVPVLEAGAVTIQKTNINGLNEIKSYISEKIDEGLRGVDLSQDVKHHFSYKPGEEVPTPDWNQPADHPEVAKQRELTRQSLKRAGFTGDKLEEEMRKWEFGNDSPDNKS